jgi:dTDP-glucose 4,6-dehydratase
LKHVVASEINSLGAYAANGAMVETANGDDVSVGLVNFTTTTNDETDEVAYDAAAEMLVMAYSKTYDIDYIITRSSNNYGPRQYEEKLIPKIISSLQNKRKIPIHGDGSYIRDWIYVKDNVSAIYHLIMNGYKNEAFNISTKNHMTNLEVVEEICRWFEITDYKKNINFVPNRLGQDIRYYIENEKLLSTGWEIRHPDKMYRFLEDA